ncbi:PRC-barrel domain-containing protein [Litchfieldia alkalitelluris]|uniref:PRC-barrel domain-containing protein n=1 Tax=Litchfieldia alkalitelluris TaxID=304268 RepID=UPI000996174A|nr:PRC-barrel domain-containing protein [Litchfieldia alkalitelluris]
MKRSIQLINLPILTITDGSLLGKVKGLIINPDRFSVDFLSLEQENRQGGIKVVPFNNVVGIGDYAVMVEQSELDISYNMINQLVSKKVQIIGTDVITEKGNYIGEVTEYMINEDSGKLEQLAILSGNQEEIITFEQVISIGKERVIVSEEAKPKKVLHKTEVAVNTSETSNIDTANDLKKKVEKLRDKQLKLLEGKTVTKNIYSNSGNLLMSQGTVLTEDNILSVMDEGPSVFIDLSMNVKE